MWIILLNNISHQIKTIMTKQIHFSSKFKYQLSDTVINFKRNKDVLHIFAINIKPIFCKALSHSAITNFYVIAKW